MNHKDWLDNEYKLWVEALQTSTVYNFKEHRQVKRMLGEVDGNLFFIGFLNKDLYNTLVEIDNIGRLHSYYLSGACIRMVYYAQKVLKSNPKSICEIGGGVGQFYAVLRALGYEGRYYIYDLPEVKKFQKKYLQEVENMTGLKLPLVKSNYEMCLSFYALGEFDDATKEWYIENVVNKCEHGFVVWSAHSGASNEVNFKHNLIIRPEKPLTLENNLQIRW